MWTWIITATLPTEVYNFCLTAVQEVIMAMATKKKSFDLPGRWCSSSASSTLCLPGYVSIYTSKVQHSSMWEPDFKLNYHIGKYCIGKQNNQTVTITNLLPTWTGNDCLKSKFNILKYCNGIKNNMSIFLFFFIGRCSNHKWHTMNSVKQQYRRKAVGKININSL